MSWTAGVDLGGAFTDFHMQDSATASGKCSAAFLDRHSPGSDTGTGSRKSAKPIDAKPIDARATP